jgi:hypothetical protein
MKSDLSTSGGIVAGVGVSQPRSPVKFHFWSREEFHDALVRVAQLDDGAFVRYDAAFVASDSDRAGMEAFLRGVYRWRYLGAGVIHSIDKVTADGAWLGGANAR